MAAIETTPAADAPPDTPANAATSAASAPKPPGNLANDAPNPLTANPPRATVQPLPAASDLAPAMPALPAPAPTDDSDSESLPSIAVLSASERASLPPLKLSMHVWNSEPGKRFAIIDGQRVTEGSTVGACIIEQIRRDGVVLNISGRRVLLPRP